MAIVLARGPCLLITAHPDDECMFFSPTLSFLSAQSGQSIKILCLSTGNATGLGHIRRQELEKSCHVYGISPSDVDCLDDPQLQDGHVWRPEDVADRVVAYLASHEPFQTVITFDSRGVSGHQNHIATCLGTMLAIKQLSSGVELWVLESLALWKKYCLFTWVSYWFQSMAGVVAGAAGTGRLGAAAARPAMPHNPISVVAPPSDGWRAMRCHRSQLVWFRYLWLLFSIYTVCNRLRRPSH